MTILIAEPNDYSKRALTRYRSLGTVHALPSLTGRKRDAVLEKTNVLVVRLAHRIDTSWFDDMPNLGIIATPTTGLNHIDLGEAKRRGITVISLKGHTSFLKDIPSTAEKTFALMLALVRNLPWAFEDVKRGKWDRDAWRGHQFIHKTLGLIGCGRLGKIVAKYAKAFGMKIVSYDPHVDGKTMKRYGVEKVSLEQLLKTSDIVSLHAPLEPSTERMLRAKHFRMMKRGSYFINTARGEILSEADLLVALRKRWIAGAALDVMRNESGDGKHLRNNPLIEYARANQNLIIVPHLGGATFEAMQVTEEFIAGLVEQACRKRL